MNHQHSFHLANDRDLTNIIWKSLNIFIFFSEKQG